VVFNTSEAVFAMFIVCRLGTRANAQPGEEALNPALRDEIRDSLTTPLRLTTAQRRKPSQVCRRLCCMIWGDDRTWTLGRMLPECPPDFSCVSFSARQACHLAVGDSSAVVCCP